MNCPHCEGNLYVATSARLYCGTCHCLFTPEGELVDAGSRCDNVDPLDMRNDDFALNEIGGCSCIKPERREVSQPRLIR